MTLVQKVYESRESWRWQIHPRRTADHVPQEAGELVTQLMGGNKNRYELQAPNTYNSIAFAQCRRQQITHSGVHPKELPLYGGLRLPVIGISVQSAREQCLLYAGIRPCQGAYTKNPARTMVRADGTALYFENEFEDDLSNVVVWREP